MTPLDALLTELSYPHRRVPCAITAPDATLASILADFRREYCVDTRLDAGGHHRGGRGDVLRADRAIRSREQWQTERERRCILELTETREGIYRTQNGLARGVTAPPRGDSVRPRFLAYSEAADNPGIFFETSGTVS